MIPASSWVNAIYDYLYLGIQGEPLEVKYTATMPTVTKPSNNMYTSSLLRHFLLSTVQDTNRIQNSFSEEEMVKWIENHISSITKQVYDKASAKSKRWIDKYYEYQANRFEINDDAAKDEQKEFKTRINLNQVHLSVVDYSKVKQVIKKRKFNFENIASRKQIIDFKTKDQNSDQIGSFGESLVYDLLVSKFGVSNVTWMRHINNAAPYDFEVINQGVKEYYEVKTTSRNVLNFFMSRNEYEFYKQCKANESRYSLIGVKNVYLKTFDSLPIIEEFRNPTFAISEDTRGFSDGIIYLTPSEYSGLIS